ncbi:hypothetical protein ACPCSP_25360 [Streptomyces cinereoruber]|uniref:hypothetical protein n=1 Tax=Streptomyces cinereoruber TaxID=67260 RepID=UPI003C2BBD51
MKKSFKLNTEPHEAEIGDVTLLFTPEVMGDDFLEHYQELRGMQSMVGVDLTDMSQLDPDKLRAVVASIRVFLARLMLPESAEVFACWDVVRDGETIGSFRDPQEAADAASGEDGATVENRSMKLPDRVLIELMEWAVELYGGGNRPTGSSSGSAQASPTAGRPGRGPSRSRG